MPYYPPPNNGSWGSTGGTGTNDGGASFGGSAWTGTGQSGGTGTGGEQPPPPQGGILPPPQQGGGMPNPNYQYNPWAGTGGQAFGNPMANMPPWMAAMFGQTGGGNRF